MADTAPDIARAIVAGFDTHYRLFRALSAQAKTRFEQGAWAQVRAANRERIEMYDARVSETVARLKAVHPEAQSDEPWPRVKQAYVQLLLEHQQPELAETFFNSVACRLLHRRYFHNQYIFWRPTVSTEHIEALQQTWRSYLPAQEGLRASLRRVLADLQFLAPWEDEERDVAAVVRALSQVLPRGVEAQTNVQVQVLSSCFYRNQAAYVVGRVLNGMEQLPFAVPVRRTASGQLYVDALLTSPADLGTLFSLARAYFMVDMEVPSAFVQFLQAILPDKPRAELYTALGLQKQGKTLFYRDLFHHLKHSSDRFVAAPGIKGMVMVVFTLPSYPYVFKMIRDRFEPPKDVDRRHVVA
jgi:isocitrate dehydrogenase kinase/phosphatase